MMSHVHLEMLSAPAVCLTISRALKNPHAANDQVMFYLNQVRLFFCCYCYPESFHLSCAMAFYVCESF